MLQQVKALIPGIALVLMVTGAHAQAPTMQEQLAAQYKLAKVGSDTSGVSITDPGTLLEVKKGGILGVPSSDKTPLTTKYEGGTVTFAQQPDGGRKEVASWTLCDDILARADDEALCHRRQSVYDQDRRQLGQRYGCNAHCCVRQVQQHRPSIGQQGTGRVPVSERNVWARPALEMSRTPSDNCSPLRTTRNSRIKADSSRVVRIRGKAKGRDKVRARVSKQQAEPQTIQIGMTTDQVQGALGEPEKDRQSWTQADLRLQGRESDVLQRQSCRRSIATSKATSGNACPIAAAE